MLGWVKCGRNKLLAGIAFDFSSLSEFDTLAQSVKVKLNCDLSLISVQKDDGLSALGRSGAVHAAEERALSARDTICTYTMQAGMPLRIVDVRNHSCWRYAPVVSEMNIGAYLGVPVRLNEGEPVGALCAVSSAPRIWNNAELSYLEAIADLVGSKIERLVLRYEQKALSDALAENDAILTTLAETSGKAITVHNDAGELVFANAALRADLELTYQELLALPHLAQRLASDGARSGAVSIDAPGRPTHALHVQLYAPKAGLTLAEWSRTDATKTLN
ncbi:GAF domain-containing protein [uncultured Tateyamaria sp.]|uniref:GAF domain-containing protein n=1 Tax=uncultured Tateyamaria sp. TaxID=455651 RepID=UPI002628A47E|nr:GAF domain-containing protein [uncultured Tateyamaria sp.]